MEVIAITQSIQNYRKSEKICIPLIIKVPEESAITMITNGNPRHQWKRGGRSRRGSNSQLGRAPGKG